MKKNIMRNEFSDDDKIKCLLWCDRHCCLCGKTCGTKLNHINKVIATQVYKAYRETLSNKTIE